MSDWVPDILGPGFAQRTLPLSQPGISGPLVATLVRRLPHPWARITGALRDVDVLYVHGRSDYFFQTDLARTFTDRGARFYALDLHRYGRSPAREKLRGTPTASTSTTRTSPRRSRRWGPVLAAVCCSSGTPRVVSCSRCGRRGIPVSRRPSC